jgi:hypothetical protein
MKAIFNTLAERAGMTGAEFSAILDVTTVSRERIYFVERLIDGLEGSYNKAGIKRWFERPRTELDGLSPAKVLKNEAVLDGKKSHALLKLARGASK